MSTSQLDDKSTRNNQTNCSRTETLQLLIHEILCQVLKKDFYGSVTLRFTVQDGIIQGLQYNLEKSIR